MTLALFIAVSIASPFLLLRGDALRRWFAIFLGAWMLLGALALFIRPFQIQIDPYLAVVTFGVCVTAAFFALVALSDPIDVRWSANRAAIVAALFYAVAILLMLRTPIDGDEPYYLLETESMVRDRDLDLSNQYRDLRHSATGRTDLGPQLGDPVGRHGQQYSRHEPFLAVLMIPGYLMGRLPGAIAVIAVFGALLARSTIRLFEDEGIGDATTRAMFPFLALGPPMVFYAARIWPEVPAAFCFVEAIRGIRQQRATRWMPALLALVLLKLRFGLVAVILIVRAFRRRWHAAIAIAILALPTAMVAFTSGNVHRWAELVPGSPAAMARGLFGLLLDGAAGLLFQAPIYIFGVIALTRWRTMPPAFRLGVSSSALYLLYLVPRLEWHGGWSPPLRYIVFLVPLLGLGTAALWDRISSQAITACAAWTLALVAHGMAYPWRLFHIQNGENAVGETLSAIWHSDFSRLFPSFIRLNLAAIVASIVAIIVILISSRFRLTWLLPILIALGFVFGRRAGDRIEFEDAHVIHRGGELYPPEFQVQRFAYRGGWIVKPGDTLSFLARAGTSRLQYSAGASSMIQIGRDAYLLPATRGYGAVQVNVPRTGRIELRCLAGTVTLDRMDHE
ncbi:MAG TPA: hypothetical protein VER58_20130 [Thermoanaerobaculia bacterium]|nr:hypothetical protein [Thermoanaerobaculia bacterium]